MTTINHTTDRKPLNWLKENLFCHPVMYVIVAIVTCGIYSIFFSFILTKRLQVLARDVGETGNTINTMFLTWLGGTLVYLFGALFANASPLFPLIALVGLGFALVQGIRWPFEARRIMVAYYAQVHHYPVQINGFLLFCFPNLMLAATAYSIANSHKG